MAGFNGQVSELLTELYLLGNGLRAFNPVLRRFHSPDALSPFDPGGINTYAYCGADPVNRTDPRGHSYRVARYVRRLLGLKPKNKTLGYAAAVMAPERSIFRWNPDTPGFEYGLRLESELKFMKELNAEYLTWWPDKFPDVKIFKGLTQEDKKQLLTSAIKQNHENHIQTRALRNLLLREHQAAVRHKLVRKIMKQRTTIGRDAHIATPEAPPPSTATSGNSHLSSPIDRLQAVRTG